LVVSCISDATLPVCAGSVHQWASQTANKRMKQEAAKVNDSYPEVNDS
jgi:hypothetical protein